MQTLSMRIFKDPDFFRPVSQIIKNRPHWDLQSGEFDLTVSNVRKEIINSVKFLIPKHLMSLILNIDPTDASIDIGAVCSCFTSNRQDMFNGLPCITDQDFDKHVGIWCTYGVKLPYPSMFLENESGGILLKMVGDKICLLTINPLGHYYPGIST